MYIDADVGCFFSFFFFKVAPQPRQLLRKGWYFVMAKVMRAYVSSSFGTTGVFLQLIPCLEIF